jgi:alkylation response protein AidB-like acyl-CoA dehydrogenase
MPIAISDEHLELARVVRAFLADNGARAANRAQLEAKQETLPPFWKALSELGWTGLHLPEAFGGEGFGLPELAIVVEELGYAVAPGPFLPTVWASAVIDAAGSDALEREVLPGLASGEEIGAVGLGGSLARGAGSAAGGGSASLAPFERGAEAPSEADGALRGDAGLVLGAGLAKWLVLAVGDDLVVVDRDQSGVAIRPRTSLDPSRRVADVVCSGVQIDASRVLPGARATALRIGRTLAAAEASGAAHACSEMAAEYAKVRVQFGRTIGTFQAVKHHCANIRVDAERATAAAWDAARAELDDRQAEYASAVAASVALPALARACQLNIQVHGGIGYTWEHDAHLYVRRSGALSAIFPPDRAQEDVTRLAAAGVKRSYAIELPPEAQAFRDEVRAFVTKYEALPKSEQRKAIARSGYLVPHWPKPYGRDAGAVEQLVIDQEFAAAGVQRPDLGISGWNTLTILQHGNAEQIGRWIWASLQGEIEFCQLFSEPNAGSDAAGVQTRAVKVEGGWRITGQKVWTSGAHLCNRGFATVRTDPDAPKHQGITMMVIDMHAQGVEVRPLRQITGQSHFNEVFFDNVFVPDADVVGPVNQGWTVARATLGNERVSIGGGVRGTGPIGPTPLTLWQRHAPGDAGVAREVGALLAEQSVMRLLNLRQAARAVAGGERGAEGNLTKLLGSEHMQRLSALSARLVGEAGAALDGDGGIPAMMLLASRGGSIAGGTSEIVRNQIAERILGLPRDPLLK